MKQIEANETNLKGYLGIDTEIGTLTIPFSQRPYEWGELEVKRLFDDLTGLYFSENQIHMLNFFTLSAEGNETKIFDGQQRTITSLLLIGAFIKILNELDMSTEAADLYDDFIVKKQSFYAKKKKDRKLTFDNKEIEDFFYTLLENNGENISEIELENDTKNTFYKNYNQLYKLLKEFIDTNNLTIQNITNLIGDILNNSNLITIKTETDELAMAMFESLNNTGKQLENYYVLKNDLVVILGENNVKEKWHQIESNLMNYNASDFLTVFATIHAGKTKKEEALKNIYESYVKQNVTSMTQLLDLLVKASTKYLYLKNPAQLANDHLDAKTREIFSRNISNLNLFITKQYHPLILAMLLKEYDFNEINLVLKALLNIGIRNIFFREDRANTIEKFIADLSKDVFVSKKPINEILSDINKIAATDLATKENIRSKMIDTHEKKKKIKFILRETYNLIDLDKELAIKNDLNDIQYEHILPVNPADNSQWVEDFKVEEERAEYTVRIGNATLLLGKINNNIKNKNFNEKKVEYENSAIPDNKEIAKLNQWTPKELEQRGFILADKIIIYLESLVK